MNPMKRPLADNTRDRPQDKKIKVNTPSNCDVCEKKCKSIYGLALHKKAMHKPHFNKPDPNNLLIQQKQYPAVSCNENKKYYFHCMGCLKKYSILTNLKNHHDAEHPEIPFDLKNCIPFEMRNNIDDLTEEVKSIKEKNVNVDLKIQELEKEQKKTILLRKVQGAVEGDMYKEELRTRWMRTFHFNEVIPNLQGDNEKEKKNFRMTQILNPILDGIPFIIEETKMFANRPEKIDVQFTQDTHFGMVIQKLNQSCTDQNKRKIELLPFVNNVIRQKILEKIGERVFISDNSQFFVEMINHQPYLMTTRKDGHNLESYHQDSYTHTLDKFYDILPLIDFSFIVPELQKYQFPKEDYDQFGVSFEEI